MRYKNKGITLIALIITILIILILVAVSIRLIINSNILATAKKAGESYEGNAGKEANLGEIVVDGITYASINDYLNNNPKISNGQYEAKNGVYVNRPDLTGFNRECTYFVTYDENGSNETIGGKINTEEPSNWYDYQNKIWANIMTKGENDTIAYLVWIPRYCYKITYYTSSALTTLAEEGTITSYGTVDVKFLSRSNVYKDYETGVETPYATLKQDGYILPETFTWKAGTDEETALAGYWVSKYEIQGVMNIAKLANGDIKVTNIDGSNTGTYEYYLNDELKATTTGLYTYTNLEFGQTYKLTVKQNGKILGSRNVTITMKQTSSEPKSIPDVTGFKDAIAYYVLYDENGGNETIGDRITFGSDGKPNNIPSNWYNYGNKIWANIVTASEELTESEKADITTATTKNVAYLVWIPRYEYKLIDKSTESDYVEGDTILKETASINFIDTSVTTPTMEGYTIPETFVWKKGTADEIQLSGYWVGKYEVSEAITN